MKAIISNNGHTVVAPYELNFDELNSFVRQNFPRLKDTTLSFMDPFGEKVDIHSNEDVELIKLSYPGQNFV
jgi:hypothetical protein